MEQLSPALSAFWATLFLIFILLTQRPLFAYFRRSGQLGAATRQGVHDLVSGLTTGACNMIAIDIGTATDGIIFGAQSGLLVPLIAVHLFVFYFGLMADVTPPVGLASYAAAGIARCDPIRAGLTAFGYSVRTAILPFMFIFNTQLLLIGIDSLWQLALTVASAILASLLFAAATQGWFLTRNRLHETLLLLLIAFSLFRPGFWLDALYPPWRDVPASQVMALAAAAPDQASLRLRISGLDLEGRDIEKGVLLPLGPAADSAQLRLNHAGLGLLALGESVQISTVRFGSSAERLGLEPGFDITAVQLPAERPAKEWLFVPTLAVLGLLIWRQRARRDIT